METKTVLKALVTLETQVDMFREYAQELVRTFGDYHPAKMAEINDRWEQEFQKVTDRSIDKVIQQLEEESCL